MSVIIKLTAPVTSIDVVFNELTLRDPTVKDLADCGIPFSVTDFGDNSSIKIDASATALLVSRLAGITKDAANAISARDFIQEVMPAVMGFFGNAPPV